jgi:hypothetical protein
MSAEIRKIAQKVAILGKMKEAFYRALAARLALLVVALISLILQNGFDLVSVWWGDLMRAILMRL